MRARAARSALVAAPALLCAALLASAPRAQTAPPATAFPEGAQDKYHLTTQERAACSSDAIRFCMQTYPDEDRLLACMKQNRDALSATCRVAFDAGVKRRRL